MDFEFLPKLPKSDLDDRTFKDLVDECILRIPRYCPEWTNYNPSDPGITLVELFAWLTDQMLLRFNQVPRRNYVAFLELLGIRLQPSTPAQASITFYLTRPQSQADRLAPIPKGTEVATERTETEEAILFMTERELSVGVPRLRHFLTADMPYGDLNEGIERERLNQIAELQERDLQQARVQLRDCFSNLWREEEGRWSGREQPIFRRSPEPGNCFYLVFDGDEPLDGNVIALTIEGTSGESTGIDPRRPPRYWEAWDGSAWQPILIQETDDNTFGFSFDETGAGNSATVAIAEVKLHLPLTWPSLAFDQFRGRWLRCRYTEPQTRQSGYSHSPQVLAFSARTIGASVDIIQAQRVVNELLGESDGRPGQVFELTASNILPRGEEDRLEVTLPEMVVPQRWQEVADFSDSLSTDLHYTLDATTGRIQFGPLVRDPSQLSTDVMMRRQTQGQGLALSDRDLDHLNRLDHQYGAVPPRGAMIRMASYQTGGGRKGNVQRGTIKILKTAIPYISRVINYQPARNGADSESLDEAVLRVPRMLRTCDRAVTPEDYETLSLQASRGIARAFCPTDAALQPKPGTVVVFVVPQVSARPEEQGLAPERCNLDDRLRDQVQTYLDERRLLGTEVQLRTPNYQGVSVQTELSLIADYQSPLLREEIRQTLASRLYQFLHPLTGGREGQGWPFGERLYKADVMSLLQRSPEVRYLEALELFSLQLRNGQWERALAREGIIDPGPVGLICSWTNSRQSWGHIIRFPEDQPE